MNTSACIIAACAANARARKAEEPVHIPTEELNYKVTLRKYYYFHPTIMLTSATPDSYPKLYEDTVPVMSITPTALNARTYGVVSVFSVKESMCPNGIDDYIKNNLDMITSTDEWKARHAQVLTDYRYDIKHEYGVDIDPTYTNYTTEYYWDVK